MPHSYRVLTSLDGSFLLLNAAHAHVESLEKHWETLQEKTEIPHNLVSPKVLLNVNTSLVFHIRVIFLNIK